MRLETTGNFQYDFGLVGLAILFDDFDMLYSMDETAIETDVSPKTIIQLVLLKTGYGVLQRQGIQKYVDKYIDNYDKVKKSKKQIPKENIVYDKNKYSEIYKQASLSLFIDELAKDISKIAQDNDTDFIIDVINQVIAGQINNITQNMINPSSLNKLSAYEVLEKNFLQSSQSSTKSKKSKNSQISDSLTHECIFCGEPAHIPLSKNTFFIGNPFYNLQYCNNSNMYICNKCAVVNLASRFALVNASLPWLGDGGKYIAVYTTNIPLMVEVTKSIQDISKEQLNHGVNYGDALRIILRYVVKHSVKRQELMLFMFRANNNGGWAIDILPIFSNAIDKLDIAINHLSSQYQKNTAIGAIFQGKGQYVYLDLLYEISKRIVAGQSFEHMLMENFNYILHAEVGRIKQENQPTFKYFYPNVFLDLVRDLNPVVYKEVKDMAKHSELYKEVAEFGHNISMAIWRAVDGNENTAKNRRVSMAKNAYEAAMKGYSELLKFFGNICITYNTLIPYNIAKALREEPELANVVGTVFATALLEYANPKDEAKTDKAEVAKQSE